MNGDPPWLAAARRDIGRTETLGPNDSPWIRAMLARLGATWLVGQPWCGGAVAYWMTICAVPIPKHWYRAKAWLDWGDPLYTPSLGCVAVFSRSGGGHVGFVVGRDPRARLLVLGGNQRDAVNISPFDTARVLGYRWPPGAPIVTTPPPLIDSSAASSTHEA